MENIIPEDLILPNDKKVHFVHNFKYLGSNITPLLDDKDIDKRIKFQIYVAGPLNALLRGCKTWNLMK
jgi:hypothetical protein